MNTQQLFEDYNIIYAGEEDRHYRPGWINVVCPFCTGNPGNHLGCSLKGGYFYCFRCGFHPAAKAISKLFGVQKHEARALIKKYKLPTAGIKRKYEPVIKIRTKAHRLPAGTGLLTERHKQYLEKRGFDPERLIKEWGLVGTGPIAMLDGINYKHRIIAPIIWNGVRVSFQGRDITERHKLKYLTCPASRELVHHKDILYGKQTAWDFTGICVEGITDVWRFGVNAFATFGIEYTNAQIRVIAKAFHRVAVVFDYEPQAVRQANKLVADLKFRGLDAWRVDVYEDPGSMSQTDADNLVKTIMK